MGGSSPDDSLGGISLTVDKTGILDAVLEILEIEPRSEDEAAFLTQALLKTGIPITVAGNPRAQIVNDDRFFPTGADGTLNPDLLTAFLRGEKPMQDIEAIGARHGCEYEIPLKKGLARITLAMLSVRERFKIRVLELVDAPTGSGDSLVEDIETFAYQLNLILAELQSKITSMEEADYLSVENELKAISGRIRAIRLERA
jgi:hypothetical protein